MNILVVENSPLIRRFICHSLQRAGMSGLSQAESGRAALNLLEADVPQLIIIGNDLAGMSGLQFALRVRMSDDFGHVSMLMISQKSTYADVFHAVKCGVDKYLVMPFAEDMLVSKVQQAMATTAVSTEPAYVR